MKDFHIKLDKEVGLSNEDLYPHLKVGTNICAFSLILIMNHAALLSAFK